MTIRRDNLGKVAVFHNSYSSKMINEPHEIIANARENLRGIKYDTLVGRGTSGMLIVPLVAQALRKKYFIVRKPEEAQSAHSNIGYLGHLGQRWIFFDDFTSSGETFHKVRTGIRDAVDEINRVGAERKRYDGIGNYVADPEPTFSTKLVGWYEYASYERAFTAWDNHVNDIGRFWPERFKDDFPPEVN